MLHADGAMDGEPELELETLLEASAYILDAADDNIVYKLGRQVDDATLEVCRISSDATDIRQFSEFAA